MEPIAQPAPGLDSVEVLNIKALQDPSATKLGHDALSPYTEAFWLPVLGPSTTFALRRFAQELGSNPEGYQVNVAELGRELGLGGTGRHSPIRHTLGRLVSFEMAQWDGNSLSVRTHVPTLSPRQVARLPVELQQSHARYLEVKAQQPLIAKPDQAAMWPPVKHRPPHDRALDQPFLRPATPPPRPPSRGPSLRR